MLFESLAMLQLSVFLMRRLWEEPQATDEEKHVLADRISVIMQRACRSRLQGPAILEASITIECNRRVLKALLGLGTAVPGARGETVSYTRADFPAEFFDDEVAWWEFCAA
eukprot:m.149521 g.149521  ORF g.149521 m.149521 type:complete len:111 (-) comp9730_c0_seq18:86-418(-)